MGHVHLEVGEGCSRGELARCLPVFPQRSAPFGKELFGGSPTAREGVVNDPVCVVPVCLQRLPARRLVRLELPFSRRSGFIKPAAFRFCFMLEEFDPFDMRPLETFDTPPVELLDFRGGT